MAFTYSKIANYTVGSGGVSTINFLNIPQNYTDLKLVVSGRTNNAATYDYLTIRFNSTTTPYSSKVLYGTGAGAASTAAGTDITFGGLNGDTATASAFANAEYYIPNYTGSTYKSVSQDGVEESNVASTVFSFLTAGLWSSSDPINSISLSMAFGTLFKQYSTAHLYGIKAEV
jgi:hypothetical protein